jgi:hypothetical protein
MKRVRSNWLFLLFMAVLLSASAAWGQSQITSGSIQGTVLDATGAVVPGASVEARNLETNITRSQTTDADGRFVFLQLPTGRYTLKITKQGFAILVQENVDLLIGQTVTLSFSLKVSAAQETVTVTDTPAVDTVKTEVSTTLNQRTVGTTPVLGRKFEDLLTLTPGVSIVQGPDGDEITFNGQRGIFTNISLDGGDYINGFFGEQVGGQRVPIDITLDAVKEFQVVATGASAEFGRTASGVVNVITKSGTNEVHGSIFHFQRHEKLSSNTSDGRSLTDFHREQFGGTIGGPIVRDRAFFFFAIERITGNLQRANLSEQLGSAACPQTTFNIALPADQALINSNVDCARLAVTSFIRTTRGQEEALPVRRPLWTTATLGKLDWNLTPENLFTFSYNFNWSKKINETFDVPTYGNSANGIEGDPTTIHVLNFNLSSTISAAKLNEAHFTYSRETRPRRAVNSNVPADTAMGITGFGDSFRFGAPFFLHPSIDELFWRAQIKDNFSWVLGKHTVKFGGEWIHSLNDQVFRGFFQGRYIFNNTEGFLRYASPAGPGGFGPNTVLCSNGQYITQGDPVGTTCASVGSTPAGGPLLLFLQGAGRTGPATDAAGASKIDNEEFALFIQDKWQIRPNFTLNYGLRWEAQIFPETVDPTTTAYGFALTNPLFPSDGTLHSQKRMFQPRVGFAWDVRNNQKSVFRASWGIFNARQNMLSQVGSVTTNGLQQQTIFISTGLLTAFGVQPPTWPGLVTPAAGSCGTNPFPCFTGVRVFHRDYRNPRIYSINVAFEQEIVPNWTAYTDFTWAKGVYLSRFINLNKGTGTPVCCNFVNGDNTTFVPGTGNFMSFPGPSPFGTLGIELGEVMTATSWGQSLYRGWTIGMRKRFSQRYQLEWNYVLSWDYDDDSNERDPFTDRSFNYLNTRLDYALSDRDIRHKFNFYTFVELPWQVDLNVRMQARSAQPLNPNPRVVNNADRGRNTLRKDNEYFSFDWRLQKAFRFGERYAIVAIVEMFNTFNNKNNINTISAPILFNFDGFLRQGVGDPRQAQFAFRFTF